MNLNFKHILQKNIQTNIIQPRRAQIYVGFQCHQRCGFCYYKHKCSDKMFDFRKITKQIDFEYDYGIRDFEITGGEPSEYTQLHDICQYIKNKDHNSKIAVITNGGLWKSDVWDIIDEVLVSYHIGRNSIYDKTIFPLGCTWDKVKKTVDAARAHNMLVRTNTVIAMFNINGLDSVADDIIELKPDIVNFLPVNLFDQAESMSQYIDYSQLRVNIKHIIDRFAAQLHSMIFIRYMPFCDMEGYEQHIVGNLQHIYDWFDWNRELDGTKMLSMIEQYNKSLAELGKYGSTSLDQALQIQKTFYIKNRECMKCKYCLICDGVENKQKLLKYIKPTKGKLVTNIMQYTQDTYNFYKKHYDIEAGSR